MIKFLKQHKSPIIVGIIVTVASYFIITILNKIPLSSIDLNFLFKSELRGPAAIISIPGIIIIFLIMLIAFIWNKGNPIIISENKKTSKDRKKSKAITLKLDQIKILEGISELETNFSLTTIMKVRKINKTEAKYHIDELVNLDLIRHSDWDVLGEPTYTATAKGRKYLMEEKGN